MQNGTKLELQVLEALWQKGAYSVREIPGGAKIAMAHLAEFGKLALDDVKDEPQ